MTVSSTTLTAVPAHHIPINSGATNLSSAASVGNAGTAGRTANNSNIIYDMRDAGNTTVGSAKSYPIINTVNPLSSMQNKTDTESICAGTDYICADARKDYTNEDDNLSMDVEDGDHFSLHEEESEDGDHTKSRRMIFFETMVLSEMLSVSLQLNLLKTSVSLLVDKEKFRQQKKDAASMRKFRQRKSWAAFASNLTDRQFRRYFRMSKECFEILCERIESNVGDREFKSEVYLVQYHYCYADNELFSTNILKAHAESTGGFISGEIKLALTLRILAGGTYLDLALLFEIGFSYSYDIFHSVISEWILDDRLVKIDGAEYFSDIDRTSAVALDFSRGSRGVSMAVLVLLMVEL